jgi:hypothetical protein
MNKLHYLILLILIPKISCAQIDLQCNGRDMHSIYLVSSNGFYRMDSVDTNPTNPILLTTNAFFGKGISINNNLDSSAGPITMYCASSGSTYRFWNGTGWTNTGHSGGSTSSAINPGGTSNYIFNITDGGNTLYRYDGTTNGTPLINNLGGPGFLHDVATDNQGNFYLFYTVAQKFIKYNPNGIPVDSFNITGFPTISGGGPGFAILGNDVYAIPLTSDYLYKGIKSGNTINFNAIKSISIQVLDLATCPVAGNPLSVFNGISLQNLIVAPNPINDKLNIFIGDNKNSEVCLYDITSRKIFNQSFTNSTSINTSQLAKGIYIYEVRNKSGPDSYREIKKGKVVKD